MDQLIRSGSRTLEFERDRAAFEHAFDLLEMRIRSNLGELRKNADESMRRAASASRRYNDSLPNEYFYIHEASPSAKGTGKVIKPDHIRQFPGERVVVDSSGNGHVTDVNLPSDGKSIQRKPKSRKNQD